MSTFGIFAFIVMPVLGGLIAWAGDVIGYRLGKSRRSLFGLRPRSTARLIGVAVGVLLPLLSLGLAMLASNDAKVAILHLDALRRVQSDLRQSNAKLQQQTEALRGQIAVANDEAKRSALHSAQLRGSLRATARQLTDADQRLNATQSRLQSAQHDVADLRSARDTLRRASVILRQQIGQLEQRAKGLEGNVRVASADLARKVKDLDEVSTELARTQAELNSSVAQRDRQAAALGSPIIYESGHELLRAIIEVGDTPEETAGKLSSVLGAASAIAAASGVQTGPNGLSVKLVKGMPPTATLTDEREIIVSTAAELQKAGKREFVIIVRVTRRLYEAEAAQAQVEFYPLPYALAFAKGETIWSVPIDGSQPRGEIFSQLWNLVTKLVRREAGKHGLLRDPETGQYGSLPANQLLESLEAVAAGKGPVTVRVRAEKDTYISDPLVIRIEVGDQEPGAGHADGAGG